MTTTRALALLLAWLCVDGGAARPAQAAVAATTSLAATTAALNDPPAATAVGAVDGTESFSLASRNVALTRSVVSSGDGWVREKLGGGAGPLAYTNDADYFVVSDLAGIDSVPLHEVVGAEFETFVKGKLRENAEKTANPAERVYVLQRSALQAAEPLFLLDHDDILADPYAALNVTICVPMPVVGGITEPTFNPEVVIREIAPGVLEYHELAGAIPTTDLANVPLGRRLGAVDLSAVRSVGAALPSGGAPAGAVAQSATSGGIACFNLLDTLMDGSGESCKIDPFDPSSWYREFKAKGTLDLNLPSAQGEATLDSTQGMAQTLLSGHYEGTMRFKAVDEFQKVNGRSVGGSVEVGVATLFCVPLWLRPTEGRLWAHAQSRREIELHGTLKHETEKAGEVTGKADGQLQVTSLDGELPDPYSIAELTFPEPAFLYPVYIPVVGPIGVLLILDAPVEIGVIAGVESPTLTNFEAEGELSLGFDYACRFGGGCTAKEPFHAEVSADGHVTGDIGLEGRAYVKPYAGLSLRLSLYFPGAIYAKVGPRASMNFDMWGASKACGDADGNGQQEWVSALTLDHDLGLELFGEIGIYDITTGIGAIDSALGIVPPYTFPLVDPWTWHLSFTNLLDNDGKAFQPMLVAPASVREDVAATFGARMRPCYPYGSDMSYDVIWGDGSYAGVEGDPGQSAALSHTWANPGTYPVKVTAVEDAHGRVFDEAFGTPLVTSLTRSVAVQAAPVVKPPLGGGGAKVVVKGR
jgi:hypothetical protein